jgi:hypothetical protein
MQLWGDKYIYVYMQFSRVTGQAGPHCFYGWTGCDSETVGRFGDSITRLGYASVYPGQTKEQVFESYKEQVIEDATRLGYTTHRVFLIGRKDYQAMYRSELQDAEEFVEAFYSPAYQGKRMVKK